MVNHANKDQIETLIKKIIYKKNPELSQDFLLTVLLH